MINLFLYPILVFSLLLFIYLIPGMAIFPKFIQTPRTAAAIPFISLSIIVSIQYFLSLINQFNQWNIFICLGILSLIALYRIYKNLSEFNNQWKAIDLKALLLIIFSSIPLMIILGFDAFQHADEIYSWNLWAKKIYLDQVVTFESTLSPYPLFLPSAIAFCYKFFGNMDYQLPIKFSFSIIYISTVFIIYSFANTKVKVGLFFISYILVILAIGIGYEYKKVYADTLMGGFLLTSLALLISLTKDVVQINKNISPISILIASVILVSAAALTKQGAFLWTMIFFPLLAFVVIGKNFHLNNSSRLVLFVPILTPLLWYFIGGRDFQGNSGVISRSMGDRSYIEQLFYGFNVTFINNPLIFILIIMAFIVLLNKIHLEKLILLIGISISTILVFLFGAYETTRLYLHIILIGWLIIFSYGDFILLSKFGNKLSKIGNSFITYILIGTLFIFWSVSSFNDRLIRVDSVSNLLDGREVQANWVVGDSGAEQYRMIEKSKMGLWARDNHVWGIYYGFDNFHRGELYNSDLDFVIDRLITENIGWIYSNNEDWTEIKRFQDFCPDGLTKIYTSKNLYKQTLYKFSLKNLVSCKKDKK